MKLTLGAPRAKQDARTVRVVFIEKTGAGPLGRRLEEMAFDGTRGTAHAVEAEGRRFIAAGLGAASRPPGVAIREASFRAAREAVRVRAAKLELLLPSLPSAAVPGAVQAAVEGLSAGAYRFSRYLSDPARANGSIESAHVLLERPGAAAKEAFRKGQAVARAVALARDLVNEPPSRLNPAAFADEAVAQARRAGLRARILEAKDLKRLGAGALLAVAQGSPVPPSVVHLVYRPRGASPGKRVVLIGKGVTFDSGGLNLKPGSGMAAMKSDMAGAAAVLATMTALEEIGCGLEVHGILGLVENVTGGRAYKPGDILQTLAGKTVEVTNTDAEGRLVLADLIAWAGKTLAPSRIVDVATLTGHVVVALGVFAAGLFSNDDALAREIAGAADGAGERIWRLPLYDDYLDDMREGPADIKNSGERWGGAITAALFLREFVPQGTPWAHLDIAGPAFLESPRGGWPAGATGASVPTLLRWLSGD